MNLLSNSCQQTGKKSEKEKNGPTHEQRYRASREISFIIAIHFFYWCQRNARKNITVTVSVRVSATVRVSLVWFVISNSFGGVKCRHLPSIDKVTVSANNIVPIRTYVSANNISLTLTLHLGWVL